MSYLMLYQNAKRLREHDEEQMLEELEEDEAEVNGTVLYQGKKAFINDIRIDTIYRHVDETPYGYGLETDYYKAVVSFSSLKGNPDGYVVLIIKENNKLLALKKAYEEGNEINLDEYIIDKKESWYSEDLLEEDEEDEAEVNGTVLYQGKKAFINDIRIDTIYRHVDETPYGYGLETDYYKAVVSFSSLKGNPDGYVVLIIKENNKLLALKKAYEEGNEINLDEYMIDKKESWCSEDFL